jgi:23S rRNA (guanosine2251-2'-O)-methyltransferase
VLGVLKTHPETVKTLFISSNRTDPRMGEIIAIANQFGISVQATGAESLERLAKGAKHQGIIAHCTAEQRPQTELADLLARAKKPILLLILDGIQDPHNLGACVRTANAAGVTAVIAPKDRAAPLNATARNVACGAAEYTPYITVTNLARTLQELKDAGVWIIGTSDDAQQSLFATDLTGPIALVLGAEEKGLRQLTRTHCDYLVQIPMLGDMSSLNVSVATGVVLFEAVRQRQVGSHHV